MGVELLILLGLAWLLADVALVVAILLGRRSREQRWRR